MWISEKMKEKVKNAELTDDDLKFIQALIRGKAEEGLQPPEKNFLYEIVNNQYNGIDVKLWDYLEHDFKTLGETSKNHEWNPDFKSLLNTARVMDVEDSGRTKQSHIVYDHKVVEYKETFDPKKVWLYNSDYSVFTMDTVRSHVFVTKKTKGHLHYDEKSDMWVTSKGSFDDACLKFFELREYATCSIRLYYKESSAVNIESDK
ncbi:hypothetical protein EMCRGX_G002016 [Ephydatia muelleri]